MFKDINIDELRNTIVYTNQNGKSITTDDRLSIIRNYMINYFVKNTDFWKQFKGIKIRNRIELEKTITETIHNNISEHLRSSIRIETLILNNKADIFVFMKSEDLYSKDKIVFDFSISL